jgi:2-polyprenyl-6-hydroxyphenyl methylase/3-demethylubiquinone-9 3-methyltransferase
MNPPSSVVAADVARFAAIADEWWDPNGKFAPLHRLNPARLAFIRETCLANFQVDDRSRAPFSGLRLIDVGCGGGLITEPMRRLGFEVTGIDAAGESLAVAGAHAESLGLSIDYRAAAIEDLVAANEPPFDVVLALEVIEHVALPGAFLADCARLMAPGGVMIVGTLNRTLKSLALAKVAAEYVLRWVPAGAHDWRQFLTPDELRRLLGSAGLAAGAPAGLVLDPLSGQWRRSGDTAINYMMAATSQAGS